MVSVIVLNGIIVTMNPRREIIERGGIAIDGNTIIDVGKSEHIKKKYSADVVLDARYKAVLPGFVNAHTHVPMTLMRGYADDVEFTRWFDAVNPLVMAMSYEDAYAASLLGCAEMIKSGITCFADMYNIKKVAPAVEKVGMRGVIADSDGDVWAASVESDTEGLVKMMRNNILHWTGKADGRITCMFGPHSPYGCSKEMLKLIREEANEIRAGIHIHVAETQKEVKEIKEKYGQTPVKYLEAIGFLGPDVLAAHCVWTGEEEIDALAKYGVKIVHNPVSNAKLAVGLAQIPRMLRKGLTIALGTDGPASNNCLDLFEEMKFAALIHKSYSADPTVLPANQVLEMGTVNGARALRLEKEVGSIEVGKKADVILVNLKSPHLTPCHDIVSHLVYAAKGSDVDTVIINGRMVMANRRILALNESNLMKDVQERALQLVRRCSK